MSARIKASARGKAKAEFYHELYRLIVASKETPSMSCDIELARFVAANRTVILNAVLMIPHFQTEAELQEERRRLSAGLFAHRGDE